MHTIIDYSRIGMLAEKDAKAIADIRDWLSETQWDTLVLIAEAVEDGVSVDSLNMAFAITGISGWPFHAFCRAHCLEAYRTWRAEGEHGVTTDAQGFTEDERKLEADVIPAPVTPSA